MLKETGRITRIDAEAAWIKTIERSTCGACHAKLGCGQNLLQRLFAPAADIKVRFSGAGQFSEYAVGDLVEIGIEEGAVVAASLLGYGLPLALLILSAWLVEALYLAPLFTPLAACLGLLAGIFLARSLLHKRFQSDFFEPVILNRVLPVGATVLDLP